MKSLSELSMALLSMGILFALSGCASHGPATISADRIDYNLAVQRTNDEELLLNIVRAHYRDNLYFTSVERIVASQEFIRSASAGFGAGRNRNSSPISRTTTRSLTLGSTVAFNEQPTIFYAPLEGEKFVRQMMTPMNPETLVLLINSGWSIDRVFMVAVQEANGLRNAPSASGPTPSYEPEYKEFREVAQLLRVLQREHNLAIERSGDAVLLRFIHGTANSETALRLKKMLKLNAKLDQIILASGVAKKNDRTITITTRPLMATINFLSQSVEVPSADVASGSVRITVSSDGAAPFDWKRILGGVFEVRTAMSQPSSASISVRYRDAWFYIDNSDLDSKSTFVLLTQLIALHSVPPKEGAPLSYSIGGG